MTTQVGAAIGQGCFHCEVGIPIEEVRSKAGRVKICLECCLLWFPGRSVAWWEARHAHLSDHVEDALQRSFDKEANAARRRRR